MRKIKTGDEVMVITGKDKGKRGKVIRIAANDRVVVENINLVKKHVRPNPQRGVEGGILDREMPLHVSNVAVFNLESGKADRVGFKMLEDGQKVRIFKSTQEVIDV
jgi:large subunit ribosomal protein L24